MALLCRSDVPSDELGRLLVLFAIGSVAGAAAQIASDCVVDGRNITPELLARRGTSRLSVSAMGNAAQLAAFAVIAHQDIPCVPAVARVLAAGAVSGAVSVAARSRVAGARRWVAREQLGAKAIVFGDIAAVLALEIASLAQGWGLVPLW